MSENVIKLQKIKKLNINDIIDIIINNDSEEKYEIIKSERIKGFNINKNNFFQNGEQLNENETNDFIQYNTRKRSNSVDIYKRRNKEKKLKNNIDNNCPNDNYNIDINNNKKNKKVTFKNPDYLTIIDVESYKQYNLENTAKDPYYDNCNNNNDNDNNNNNNEKKKREKEKVVCSCLVF